MKDNLKHMIPEKMVRRIIATYKEEIDSMRVFDFNDHYFVVFQTEGHFFVYFYSSLSEAYVKYEGFFDRHIRLYKDTFAAYGKFTFNIEVDGVRDISGMEVSASFKAQSLPLGSSLKIKLNEEGKTKQTYISEDLGNDPEVLTNYEF